MACFLVKSRRCKDAGCLVSNEGEILNKLGKKSGGVLLIADSAKEVKLNFVILNL